MAKKVKLTAFSRFILVMIVLVPAAYLGAAYYNGQDGIQNIKDLIGIESSSSTVQQSESKTVTHTTTNNSQTKTIKSDENLELKVKELEKRIKELEAEVKELRQ